MQTTKCSQGVKYKLTTRKNFTNVGVQDVDKAAETHINKAKMHHVTTLNTIATEGSDRLAWLAKPRFHREVIRIPSLLFPAGRLEPTCEL